MAETALDNVLDAMTIVSLDWQEEVLCTYERSRDGGQTWTQCAAPAAWTLLLPCCGAVRYACHHHLSMYEDVDHQSFNLTECVSCGHRCAGSHCEPVVTPIGRS